MSEPSPRTSLAERIYHLQKEAIALQEKGASPKGVWIERFLAGCVPPRPGRKKFDQVVWKSDKPHAWLSGKKSRYIGKLDSDAHILASAKFTAGKKLRQIESEIQAIEKKINTV
ncbi:hypothetical protein TUMEXPCC7403_02460 [Tumidithrix helvetica PCC 7403]|uniref:hypothetical protein n=1 Tax=Tumidithrix helvetica TaxID=3457545 RepID=UPI003CB74003